MKLKVETTNRRSTKKKKKKSKIKLIYMQQTAMHWHESEPGRVEITHNEW